MNGHKDDDIESLCLMVEEYRAELERAEEEISSLSSSLQEKDNAILLADRKILELTDFLLQQNDRIEIEELQQSLVELDSELELCQSSLKLANKRNKELDLKIDGLAVKLELSNKNHSEEITRLKQLNDDLQRVNNTIMKENKCLSLKLLSQEELVRQQSIEMEELEQEITSLMAQAAALQTNLSSPPSSGEDSVRLTGTDNGDPTQTKGNNMHTHIAAGDRQNKSSPISNIRSATSSTTSCSAVSPVTTPRKQSAISASLAVQRQPMIRTSASQRIYPGTRENPPPLPPFHLPPATNPQPQPQRRMFTFPRKVGVDD